MDPLMGIASDSLASELRRAQVHGHNVANAATPGYKRAISFEAALGETAQRAGSPRQVHYDLSAGPVRTTGGALDLMAEGAWLMVVRDQQQGLISAGAFARADDGALVTADGWALADADGAPLTVRAGLVSVEPDGSVLGDGMPIARLQPQNVRAGASVRPLGGSVLAVAQADSEPSDRVRIRTGVSEAANVNTGVEMLGLMQALRRAEAGQKLVHVYDDLIGGALQRLGDL